ncbi:MAG: hypothetical protein OXN94_10660, partial [Chloroflexota bacterium]|nr:hypothetical protein [Chloroflexota bacterium]
FFINFQKYFCFLVLVISWRREFFFFLVDTAGRSPLPPTFILELHDFVDSTKNMESNYTLGLNSVSSVVKAFLSTDFDTLTRHFIDLTVQC